MPSNPICLNASTVGIYPRLQFSAYSMATSLISLLTLFPIRWPKMDGNRTLSQLNARIIGVERIRCLNVTGGSSRYTCPISDTKNQGAYQ